MPEIDLIELFAVPLARQGIRSMICGSVAAMLYGEPRLTNDIDLVVVIEPDELARIQLAFPSTEFYLPPREILEVERTRSQRGHFNIIHLRTALKADCYLAGRDPLHHWALARAVSYSTPSHAVALAPPEYVILRKLEYWREGGSDKHVRDILAVMQVSGDQVDHGLLQSWIQRLGLQPEWERIRPSLT